MSVKWGNPKWNVLGTWVQALCAILMIIMTILLTCISNNLVKRSNEIATTARKASIRPIIRVSSQRYGFKYSGADCIVIKISNIGSGTAKDINIIVNESDTAFSYHLFYQFYPVKTFPVPHVPHPDFARMPISPDNDTLESRDFLLPGQQLEFQYGSSPLGYRSVATCLILYISYLDIDDNEYMTITSLIPGANMDVALFGEKRFFDSLARLPQNKAPFEYNTIENLGIRTPGKLMGTEQKWGDSFKR
jgi:hypothetical protein